MPDVGGPPVQQNLLFGLRPIRSSGGSPTTLFRSAFASIREQSKSLSLTAAFCFLRARSSALRCPSLREFLEVYAPPGETAPPGIVNPAPGLAPPPGVTPPVGLNPPGLIPPLEPVPAPLVPEYPPLCEPKPPPTPEPVPCSTALSSNTFTLRARFVDMLASGRLSEASEVYGGENELKAFVRSSGSGNEFNSGKVSVFVKGDGTKLSVPMCVLVAIISEPSD